MKDNPFLIYTYIRSDHLAGCVVVDEEYPSRVAYDLIHVAMQKFDDYETTNSEQKLGWWQTITEDCKTYSDCPFLQSLLTQYQEPVKADKILAVQQKLEETKDIMHQNIEMILQRGESLDSLMKRSQDLSEASIKYYKTAKRLNSCCRY
jgi:synaptobrevin family protein YKT6